MSRILYIGNKLSGHNINTTYIEILGPLLESEGFQVIYASEKLNKVKRLFDMIVTTIKYRKKVNYVLIDTYSTNGFIYTLCVSQLCRLFNLKYLPILHGGNLPYRFKKNFRTSKLIFNNAYLNIAPSGYIFDAFVSSGFKNIQLVPNCIEIDNYEFFERKSIQPKLLWVRAFNKIYNPKMAILLLNEIVKTYPKAQLCMVGMGDIDLLNECKKLAKTLNLDVIFTGKLSKESWIDLSRQYDFFINTTHVDNTPISVIEAMSLGLGVVSTNVGGISYLVQDTKTGVLVNDEDFLGMNQSLLHLLETNLLFDTITFNARKYVENFDWKIVKELWLKILN